MMTTLDIVVKLESALVRGWKLDNITKTNVGFFGVIRHKNVNVALGPSNTLAGLFMEALREIEIAEES